MTIDFSASMVRAAGASPRQGRPFDGIDILRREEEQKPVEKRALFWRARRGDTTHRAVREGSLKYIRIEKAPGSEEHLFDLHQDPGEQRELLAERTADVPRLRKLLDEWEERVKPVR